MPDRSRSQRHLTGRSLGPRAPAQKLFGPKREPVVFDKSKTVMVRLYPMQKRNGLWLSYLCDANYRTSPFLARHCPATSFTRMSRFSGAATHSLTVRSRLPVTTRDPSGLAIPVYGS
jgi:hypothetical protein